jgi:protein-L-isoaspartate(D-aspartate) O-methyltransferase
MPDHRQQDRCHRRPLHTGIPKSNPAIIDGDSLAYFALDPLDDKGAQGRWRLGAIGHGPHGQQLAEGFCRHITAWDNDRAAQPTILCYPADTTTQPTSDAIVINKPGMCMTVTFPPARATASAA